jgi:hypothetical protein
LPTIDLNPAKRLEVLNREMNNKRTSIAAPSIAFDAASQPLAIAVNLDELFPATVALHLAPLDALKEMPRRNDGAGFSLHSISAAFFHRLHGGIGFRL